jgi:hypothetical protein
MTVCRDHCPLLLDDVVLEQQSVGDVHRLTQET